MKKLLLIPLSLAAFACNAQIMHSNGALMSVGTGAIVYANGGITVSNTSAFTNDGTITTTKNSTLPLAGSFNLENSSVVSGNGTYSVEQDWINSAVFNAGTSIVRLFGNTQQFITSNNGTATTFNNLELSGTGTGANRKKTLQGVDATVGNSGTLTINDRELETQTQTFFVTNTAVAAVTNLTVPGSEGFVSSLSPGTFSRQTNSTSVYVFPTGSSAGTLRYRPIELVPNDANPNTYVVRMNNQDATTQGFDRAINDGNECELNPVFFHSINRVAGTSSTDVRSFYIVAADGDWSGLAHWRTTNNQWNDMVAAGSSTSGVFKTRTRAAWAFANPGDPYVLTNVHPDIPVVNCPSLCQFSGGNIFTASGNTITNSYQWTFPSNGTIGSGQGTSSVAASWETGVDTVSVIAIGINGCNSLPGTCTPTIIPPPVVQFSYIDDLNNYTFTDLSTGGLQWNWSFGDGSANSSAQNPSHTFPESGSYQVILAVTNAAGCNGFATQTVEIMDEIIIPNVMSPNGDGINDLFLIQSGGLKKYDLVILNRWGIKVFSSTDANTHWDGKIQGKAAAEGVYFYILKASTASKELEFHGNVTLFN